MRRFTTFSRLALATLAVAAWAGPLAAGDGRPWIQTAAGEIVGFTDDGAAVVAFSGRDNLLGRFAALGEIRPDPTDPTGLSYTFAGVMTGAAGSIFYEGEGTFHPLGADPELPLPFTERLTVTGGTGRFRHASGWAHVVGIARGTAFHTVHKGKLSY